MSDTAQVWVIAKRPGGEPVGREHFRLEERTVGEPGAGEVKVRLRWLGFDPAQRSWMDNLADYVAPTEVGGVMPGNAVAEVVASGDPRFKPGDLVTGLIGWQTLAVVPGRSLRKIPEGVPPTATLGILGITGLTAYFGLMRIGRPEAGETLVVSAAAGSTGSTVVQLGRIMGLKVIGIAGGPEKCAFLRDELKADGVIDYKNEDVGKRLDALAPAGVDIFYDNVGGPLLDTVLARIAHHGRIVVCGAISQYNTRDTYGPKRYLNLILRRARMEGFIVTDFAAEFDKVQRRLARWIADGRLVYREDVMTGFENAPKAFLRLFTGENRGKQILKV